MSAVIEMPVTTFSATIDDADYKCWESDCGQFSVVQYAQWGMKEGAFFCAYRRSDGARITRSPVGSYEQAIAAIPEGGAQ